jgi:WD40 repeat protein
MSITTLCQHTYWIRQIIYSNNEQIFASCGLDKRICIWNSNTKELIKEIFNDTFIGITSIAFSPDDKEIVFTSCNSNLIRFINIETSEIICKTVASDNNNISSIKYVSLSNNENKIIYSSAKKIYILNAKTMEQIGEPLIGHTDYILSITISNNGKMIASCGMDKKIYIWNIDTMQQIGISLIGHTDYVRTIAFNSDDSQLISGGDDCMIYIWNVIEQKQVQKLCGKYTYPQPHHPFYNSYITNDPQEKMNKSYHTFSVVSVKYSKDGSKIISGSGDYSIRVWNASTYEEMCEPIAEHTKGITSIDIDSNNQIVSTSFDNTIKLWNL